MLEKNVESFEVNLISSFQKDFPIASYIYIYIREISLEIVEIKTNTKIDMCMKF